MAYDEFLADRVRQIFNDKSIAFREKSMMGGLIFMVDDKMCIGVDIDRKTEEDRLMARIGKEAYETALEEAGAREMKFTGKVMRGFVFIYPDGIDTDEDLEFWVQKAIDFNPLAKKSKRKKS